MRSRSTRCRATRTRIAAGSTRSSAGASAGRDSGTLDVVRELVARAAPRLLKLADGERRLGNYLQVAEEVQNARTRVLGEAGEADWLARRIDDADEFDEAQQLRLESDAKRVRIMTLHKAKGLEFDLVFLPFAGLATAEPWSGSIGLVADRVDGRRALRAKIPGIDDEAYAAAADRERQELLSEQLRLLYVGLTRARHAAWLYAGVRQHRSRREARACVAAAGRQGWQGRKLERRCDRRGVRTPREGRATRDRRELARPISSRARCRCRSTIATTSRCAKRIACCAATGGCTASRSSRARSPARNPRRSTSTARKTSRPRSRSMPIDSPYVGARFGNALHAALETIDFARWRDWQDDAPPPDQEEALRRALGANGYVDDGIAGGLAPLTTLVRDTVNARLPEGVRLADIAPANRRAEIEFHFALHPVLGRAARRAAASSRSVARSRRLRHARTARGPDDGPHRSRLSARRPGVHRRLQEQSARRLFGRRASRARCARANTTCSTSSTRWRCIAGLRFRRADYDYDAHFGGVRYLFCRGLDPSRDDAPGVFVARPSRELIEALDALLAPPRREAA